MGRHNPSNVELITRVLILQNYLTSCCLVIDIVLLHYVDWCLGFKGSHKEWRHCSSLEATLWGIYIRSYPFFKVGFGKLNAVTGTMLVCGCKLLRWERTACITLGKSLSLLRVRAYLFCIHINVFTYIDAVHFRNHVKTMILIRGLTGSRLHSLVKLI